MDEGLSVSAKRRPLVDIVAEEITYIILRGQLRPGDKLNELEIAQRLGVSRGPVREAIRQLQQTGLLETQAFRGSFVRTLNQRQIAEIYALRLILETTAIAEATRLATANDLARIERAWHDSELAAGMKAKDKMIEADVEFHTAICAAGHNERITETFSRLATELRLVHLFINPDPDQMRSAAEDHAVILEDFKSRSRSQAVAAVRRHIEIERDEILQELGPAGHSVPSAWRAVEKRKVRPEVDELNLTINIRSYEKDDLPLLAGMNRELVRDEGHRNPMTVPELEVRFRNFVEKEGYQADLFTIEDEIIGYALYRHECDQAQPTGRRVNLRQFYIARHRRRSGAGHVAFMELVKARFKEDDRVFFEIMEADPGGRVFWLRNGFVPYSSILEYVVGS